MSGAPGGHGTSGCTAGALQRAAQCELMTIFTVGGLAQLSLGLQQISQLAAAHLGWCRQLCSSPSRHAQLYYATIIVNTSVWLRRASGRPSARLHWLLWLVESVFKNRRSVRPPDYTLNLSATIVPVCGTFLHTTSLSYMGR